MHLRLIILLILSTMSMGIGTGQSHVTVDSLEKALDYAHNDTVRVNVLNDLAFEHKRSDPTKAIQYAEAACSLAIKIEFVAGQASCLLRLGTIAMLGRKYEEAENKFNQALGLRKAIGIKTDIASVYNLLGLIYYYKSDDSKAVEFYRKGLNILENETASDIYANICNNLGNSYRYLGDYEEAIKYITIGAFIKEKLGDELGQANLLLTLGNWYTEMDNGEKAIANFKTSLSIFEKHENENGQAKCYINLGNAKYRRGEYEEALKYFEKALKLEAFLEKNNVASIHRSTGNIYRSLNKPIEAMNSFLKSLEGFTVLEDDAEIASLHYNIGLLHKDDLAFSDALLYFKNCQEILDTIREPLLSMKLAHEMSETYSQLDQEGLAFQYSLKHNALQDSLDKSYREATNYKHNYEEERQKNEILEKELHIQKLKDRQRATVIRAIGLVVFLLLGFAILTAHFRNRRIIAEQEVILAYQEIDSLLKEQEVKTTYAKLEGQDEERKRIAQDLHDRVGSILSTVKLYFDGFGVKLDAIHDENRNRHNKANLLLDKAVSEVRKIAQNIHSGTLTKFGLKAELEVLSELLKNSDRIQVDVVTHGLEERLPIGLEIKIYRIIQELISNVLKHAQATKIIIQLNQFKGVVNVIVQDNGKGFNPDLIRNKKGMGLRNIESRVYDIHGSIIIDSGKGNGTTVTIDIPWEE